MDRLGVFGLCVVLLLACGACARPWTFAPPGRLAQRTSAAPASEYPASHAIAHGFAGGYGRVEQSRLRVTRLPEVTGAVAVHVSWLDAPADAIADPAAEFSDATGGLRLRSAFRRARRRIAADHRNYYSWPATRDLLWGISAASILANTSLDGDFQDWYQDDVRCRGLDDCSSFWKVFGEGEIFVPAFAGLAVLGTMLDDRPLFEMTGEFGGRTTRAYLVGTPPMLFMQCCLGGSRPGEVSDGSYWRPFEDNNGVSGHAFVGAVPFMTAARMSENRLVKGCFYFFSTLPAWSRVNDDSHYLSQAALGWWMAYLACRAVDQTQQEERNWTLTPVATPGMAGAAVIFRR